MAGPAGPILVLRVGGQIDITTIDELRAALAAAIEERPTALVVDLAAVTFCCARGFHTLLAEAPAAARTSYAVSGLHPHLDRIPALMPVWQRCTRYRSAAAAITAVWGEQSRR